VQALDSAKKLVLTGLARCVQLEGKPEFEANTDGHDVEADDGGDEGNEWAVIGEKEAEF